MAKKQKSIEKAEEMHPDESPSLEVSKPPEEEIAEDPPAGELQGEGDEAEEILEETEEETIKKLANALTDSEAKAEEYLDGWQRSAAEFANYKKRVNREKAEFHQYAKGEIIKGYLEILDDLERALEDRPEKGEGATWSEGIEMIYRKLLAKLEAEGVKPMKALGEQFDPNIHEALMQEESEHHQSGEIIEVLKEGYWIGDKVLRPALVRIAA